MGVSTWSLAQSNETTQGISFLCACMLACLHAGMLACWHAFTLACLHAGMLACWHACVLAWDAVELGCWPGLLGLC